MIWSIKKSGGFNISSYDKLRSQINDFYNELSELPESDRISLVRAKFRLTSAEVNDFLGIKDELDFVSIYPEEASRADE